MSINLTQEHAVPLAAVAKLSWVRQMYANSTGSGPSSQRPHVATIHRWVTRGIRGVRLEYLQVGGTRVTTEEALQRFFQKLTDPKAETRPAKATPNARAHVVGAELDRLLGSPKGAKNPRKGG